MKYYTWYIILISFAVVFIIIGYFYMTDLKAEAKDICINECNDKKYNHLNGLVVVFPDSSVSSKGYCDGYGLVKICDSDQVYDCRQSNYWKDEPIAISNSIYMLMKDDPRFLKLIKEFTDAGFIYHNRKDIICRCTCQGSYCF